MSKRKIHPGLRASVWAKSQGRCHYCGFKLDNNLFTCDHIYPRSKGGKTEIGNLVASCPRCNRKKKDLWNKKWKVKIHQGFQRYEQGRTKRRIA
jgi:5-methylcytosine-specific restriction endonuclease McrA